MSRRRVNQGEVRIHRTISVSPSFWERYKAWCRGKSMSELLEMAALRMMDEKNDILSLSQQAEELRQLISTKKYEVKKLQIELENEEHNLNVIEERMSEIRVSDKAKEEQQKNDFDWMKGFKTNTLGKIRRGFSRWMHEDGDRAAYLPGINQVKERTGFLDNMTKRKAEMAWIALKFEESDWEIWLTRTISH
jgi:hypothetical protein